MSGSDSIQIRKASLTDLHDIWLLSKRFLPDCQGISYENFQSLWRHRYVQNPLKLPDDCLGYVFTTLDGKVRGFFGIIPLRLQMRGKTLRAVASSSWVVDPEYRKHSLLLFQEFISKNKDDFLLVTTAGDVAAVVCEKFGAFEKVPIVDYEQRLIWWIYPKVAVQYKLKQKGAVYRFLSREPFATALAFLIHVRSLLLRNRIVRKGQDNHVGRIARFGKETDQFLEKYKKQFDIMHWRSAEFLNWRHLDIPSTKGISYVFVSKNVRDEMNGYLVVRNLPPPEGYPGYWIVTDIMYDTSRSDIIGDLLYEAYASAKEHGASLFEVFGFNRHIMNYCLQFQPHIKKRPHCTYWYKAPDEKTVAFCRTAAWWTSGIDGDSSL
ncbi:MAG: hypothetical protein Q7S48_04850 [bacterium]|nr:hypothetical protein [bacterium]